MQHRKLFHVTFFLACFFLAFFVSMQRGCQHIKSQQIGPEFSHHVPATEPQHAIIWPVAVEPPSEHRLIGVTVADEELKTDDGTVESGVVMDDLIVVNRLTPASYPATLQRVRIRWDEFQNLPSPLGKSVQLLVFTDSTGSGHPVSPVTLSINQSVTISQTGAFLDFSVNPVTIGSGDVYVGFQAPSPAQGVGFSADTNSPPQQRAFYSTNDGSTFQGPLQFQDGTRPNILLRAVVSTSTGSTEELKTDDGTVDGRGFLENKMMMVNRLTPGRFPATLETIRIYFVSFQGQPSPVGGSGRLVVYADPQGTGIPPVNAQPVISQSFTISRTGSFEDFAVPAVSLPSGDFYVGYQAGNPANGVGFAADSNGPAQLRSFYSQNDGVNFQGPLRFSDGATANLMIRARVRYGGSTDTQSPSVNVVFPNGGETLSVGGTTQIRWTSSDNTGVSRHEVWLSVSGGASYPTALATGLAGTAQAYQWIIPNTPTLSARVKVVAVDAAGNSGMDTSNGNFTISSGGDTQPPTVRVLSPNGGEQLTPGAVTRIAWTSTDTVGMASHTLSLSTDGGGSFPTSIMTGVPPAAQEFFWSVPLIETLRGRIKVSAFDTSSNEGFDISDQDFQIQIASSGDFSLSANPTAVSLSAGELATLLLSATGTDGFQSSISLTATVSPPDSNVRVAFQDNPLRIGTTTTGTITTTSPLTAENYTLTLTGSGGGKTHSLSIALSIWKPLGSKPVGTEGGTISAEGFKLKIPPGALSESSLVTVSENSSGPDDAASKQYRITGLTPFSKSLKLTIPLTKSVAGTETYASVTCLSSSVTSQQTTMEPAWLTAKIKGDSGTVSLPAMPTTTVAGQREDQSLSAASRVAVGESVKEFFVNLVDTTAWRYVDSQNNHFKLTYRNAANEARVTQLAAALEQAYSGLQAVGLSWDGRTKWPIRVCVGEFKDPKEKAERWGEEVYPGLWGVNYAWIMLNEDKLNAPNSENEFKVTVSHELFHLLQDTYVAPSLIQDDAYYWMREACAVWFERKVLPSVCPSVLGNSDAMAFPLDGVGMVGESQAQDHGYGASMFLSFLTSSYKDETIIGRIWQNSKKKYSPIAALGEATNDPTWTSKWIQFAAAYFTGVNADRCWPPANSTQALGQTWDLKTTTNQNHTFSVNLQGLSVVPLRVKVLTSGFRADQKLTLEYRPNGTSSVVSVYKIQDGVTTLLGNTAQSFTIQPLTDFQSQKTFLVFLAVNDSLSGSGTASLEVRLEGENKDVTYAMKPFTKVSTVWSPSVLGQRKGRIVHKGAMTGPNLTLVADHILWPTDETLTIQEVETLVSGKGATLPLSISYPVESFDVDGATPAENQSRSWTTIQPFSDGGREVSTITFVGYMLYDRYGVDKIADSTTGTFNLTVTNQPNELARYRIWLSFSVYRERFDKNGKKTGSSGPSLIREEVLWFEFRVQ